MSVNKVRKLLPAEGRALRAMGHRNGYGGYMAGASAREAGKSLAYQTPCRVTTPRWLVALQALIQPPTAGQ